MSKIPQLREQVYGNFDDVTILELEKSLVKVEKISPDGLVSAEGWGPTVPGDGPVTSLERAVELIQRNTRHYAKRQLSYWGRDKSIRWMEI